MLLDPWVPIWIGLLFHRIHLGDYRIYCTFPISRLLIHTVLACCKLVFHVTQRNY